MNISVEKKEHVDLRITRTQKNIRKAFYELCKTKSATSITVRELTELAEINKSTFYLHFESIPHLIEILMDESIAETIGSDTEIRLLIHDPGFYITQSTHRIIHHPFSQVLRTGPVELRAQYMEKFRVAQEQKLFSFFPELRENHSFQIVSRIVSYGSVNCFLTAQDPQSLEEITYHVSHITELLWKEYHFQE